MFQKPIELINCQTLYNILNESFEFAKVCDPNYLYLLDCRERLDYNESHITCAKRIKRNENGEFVVPDKSQLECRNLIVVYDSNSSNLKEGDAVECAKFLFEMGSKFTVRVLQGGYELFSRMYPFLRTQQIIYMPRELDVLKTYPSEIIPELLYLGSSAHANSSIIRKDLKLKAYVNCTKIENLKSDDKGISIFNVPIEDLPTSSIAGYISNACSFIESCIKDRKQACLVYSEKGLSRSAAIVISYLIYLNRLTVQVNDMAQESCSILN